mgnify:CR=1 FL=1
MVTLIILTAVVICLLALLIAILYMRNEEVQVTDKATDLADILLYRPSPRMQSSMGTVTSQ